MSASPPAIQAQLAILNALAAPIALLDASGAIVAVNDAWRRLRADTALHNPDIVVGHNYLDVCEHAAGEHSEDARSVATGIRSVLQGDINEFVLEYLCHSSPEARSYRASVTPLPDGRARGVVVMHVETTGNGRDAAAVRRTEQLARESEQRLGFALGAADIGDWDMDLRTNVTRRSLRHDQCFGYSEAVPEWGYDTFLSHVHTDDRERVDQTFRSAMSGAEEYDVEFRTVWGDQSEHWLWSKGRFYFDSDGAPYRVAGIQVDVTARKHSKRVMREQAEFVFDETSGQAIRMLGTVLDITEPRANEVALTRALERLRNAQRIGEIGDWEWDFRTKEMSWSPHLFEITQRDPSDGPPRDYAELEQLFDESVRASLKGHVMHLVNSGEAQRYELIVVRPNGERIPVEAYAVPERDASGVVRFLRGTMQDISSRKRAEAVLAVSEQRLELATQSAGIGIWDYNLLNDTLMWDKRMLEMYGIAEQDFTGTFDAWWRCVHPEDGPRIAAAYADAVSGERAFGITFRVLWPSGQERHLEAHAVVQRNVDGAPVRMIGVNWDITTRKREEAVLAQLADIVASSDDAIIGNDLQNIVTSWNRGAEKVFGFSAAEMVGSPSMQLLPDDRQREEAELVRRVLNGESVEQFETIRRVRSGRAIEVSITASPMRDAIGRVVGISTVTRDISERKKLERQFYRAQRMESIGTLASGIAHDLNNALTPILLSLDLLKSSFPDPQSQEVLAMVGTSARHAAGMVQQVLSFARGVEGKRLQVDMQALVGDVEKIGRDTFPKQITITTRIAPDLRAVLGDRTQLHQVLVNLCVNARDAMPNGGRLAVIAENVRCEAQQDPVPDALKAGDYVCLRIEDSGEGMSPELIERMFEPFFTTKEVGKGTGLGLSTSLAIIRSHGGVIRVYSELARGTTVTLYLPAHLDSSDVPSPVAEAARRGNGELILVVDDEPAVLGVTKRILEAYGYRVLLSSDGMSALALFDAHRAEIAVILTDMMMPVMDGPTMIRALRVRDPAVRIIGTSGLSSHQYDESSPSRLRHFVPKPCAADTLLRTVQSILDEPPPRA